MSAQIASSQAENQQVRATRSLKFHDCEPSRDARHATGELLPLSPIRRLGGYGLARTTARAWVTK
jgi:hypothetical protein